MPLLCIYHANCADGFTAAWAVWKKHPDTEFLPGFYGKEPPNCAGRDVVMVDFSYKRDVLLQIAAVANSVLILDHHKSAQADLVDLPANVTAVFDMERSGAMMAWQHYHPERSPSDLVVHVQDRDLWQFKRSQTRAFQANLFSHEYTFENWDAINSICADDYKYHQFVLEGEAIERKHFKDIKVLIRAAATRCVIAGVEVPTLNCPYFFSSDAGHEMCQGEPFAACYYDTGTHRVFSLRSAEDGGADVSVIAASFGGGGHKHAAGFRLALSDLHKLSYSSLDDVQILNPREQQLNVAVDNGLLSISIGVDILAHAVSMGPAGCKSQVKVTDADVFAEELAGALKWEEEDGTTNLHRLLDKAANFAAESGAEGIDFYEE